MSIKETIHRDLKVAMKARDQQRVSVLRLLLAAIKQIEIDQRRELGDVDVMTLLNKQVKQRRESIAQYEQGGRQDLAEKERAELGILQPYLPAPLSDAELQQCIAEALANTTGQGMKAMGAVMAYLTPKVQGRTDMKVLSAIIREKLSA